MDINETIRSVCILSGGLCAVRYIAGGTAFAEQMGYILKMIFFIVLITPFVSGKFSFELPEIPDYRYAEYGCTQEEYENELKRCTAENVSQVLAEQISAANVICRKIETEVNISDDSSIIISKVIVSADDFAKAAEVIRSTLGAETEVINADS
ncbi:MAG: hypothetical protein MJ100_05580 [Ruminococcus sp.]|nr:hypothetical protein [Ruminococcus sp.]